MDPALERSGLPDKVKKSKPRQDIELELGLFLSWGCFVLVILLILFCKQPFDDSQGFPATAWVKGLLG